MKTILTSIVAVNIFAMLAAAQPTATAYGRRGFPYNPASQRANIPTSAGNSGLVYVITIDFQFGAVDLRSGSFLSIGPGLPPDVGTGLVHSLGTSLLSLAFTGNLDAIDPFTGKTSVIGATGLHDCSAPGSYDPKCANVIGRLDGTFYVTDFANNLYSVDPTTGAAKLIGLTGIPAITFAPFSQNPDGSVNVYDESLFSFRGKLYTNFATLTINFATGVTTPLIPAALYEINPNTGRATWIAPTEIGLPTIVNVNDTLYAFSGATGQVVTLDLATGQTTPVSVLDPAVGVVAGATTARPAPAASH